MPTGRLRILNASTLLAVTLTGERFLRGSDMNDKLVVIEDGGVAVDSDGLIFAVGPTADVKSQTAGWSFDIEVDATGKSILPGFVDGHSHPVWAGNRCHEFKMKLAGASYLDIHKKEGGIAFTAKCTKAASEAELQQEVKRRFDRMIALGTTTVEAKSGYGFDTETELKQLRVLNAVSQEHPITVVSTFLGAHGVPPGLTSIQATRKVVDEMLPAVISERDRGLNSVEAIDVFCEKGVFSTEESEEILKAGKQCGLMLNFHGDELNPMSSGELAGRVGADAVSHLEHVSAEGIKAMSIKPTFAVLLPSTAYVLRITPPPARTLIDGGVPVALGSDFCPNAHSLSMPFTMNLACVMMKMTINEAIVASTLNSAASIGKSHLCGSLEKGKWGDLIVVDAPYWEHIVYEMGDAPIVQVFKMGARVFSNGLA